MIWLIFILLALFALVIAAKKINGEQSVVYEYEKHPVLFSPAERSFLGVLDAEIGAEYRIFGKVRVADVLKAKSSGDKNRNRSAFNKIQSKHFDYIVCDKNDLSVLCVIELDDKSHNQRDRQELDVFLETACGSAQLTLLRFEAKKSYSVSEVSERVFQAIGVDKNPAPVAPTQEIKVESAPVCPKCAAPMVKRTAKSGQYAGKQFLACSTYPQCKSIQEIVT